ncbi:MAG: acetyl-CoA C-acetyltransferase [Caldilineaceae bacterium]|nr:acetyl-CoA C-acetyltransferase [Caldilineaceae bacterium]
MNAYIFDAIRTPRGRGKENGALHPATPVRLLTTLFDALRTRHALDTSQVDDVILGCVTPIGEQGANIARTALLCAGWAQEIPGMQLNRFCASGLEAVNSAAAYVRAGWGELMVAGGVESMSRVPIGADGGALMQDPAVAKQIGFVPQGISADLIATLEGLSRADVDAYALHSQQRAGHAEQNGYFTASRVPVYDNAGGQLLAHDEHARPNATLEGLSQLKPAFAGLGQTGFDAIALRKYPQISQMNHVHTAGNSSGIVDGAALVLVGTRHKGEQLGLQPRAVIRAAALVGTEPTIMLTGPAPAAQKALRMAGMTLADIDLIEVNEAFAAVVLKFMHDMAIADLDKINVNGGAIALGHPLGATGAMLLGTALDELERRGLSTALITLCAGGGMGIATIIERV